MKFSEFQATGRDVPDLRAFPHIAAQFADADEDKPAPGRVYVDGLYIEKGYFSDGLHHWFVTISNGGTESMDLAVCERELFEFAISEGYIEGPTTEEELIEALQGLQNAFRECIGRAAFAEFEAGNPAVKTATDLLARLS